MRAKLLSVGLLRAIFNYRCSFYELHSTTDGNKKSRGKAKVAREILKIIIAYISKNNPIWHAMADWQSLCHLLGNLLKRHVRGWQVGHQQGSKYHFVWQMWAKQCQIKQKLQVKSCVGVGTAHPVLGPRVTRSY